MIWNMDLDLVWIRGISEISSFIEGIVGERFEFVDIGCTHRRLVYNGMI